MELLELIVACVDRQTPDVCSYELKRADGGKLPAFEPGSHIDLHLGNGLIRQYSLCNGPQDVDSYVIGVKREQLSRGGSKWVHDTLVAGDLVRASHPKNNFPLSSGARRYVLLAGGIGITPVLSMARHLAAENCLFEMHYFVRSTENVAFRDALETLEASGMICIHDGLSPVDTGAALADALSPREDGDQLYMCGPGPFMDLSVDRAADCGWPQHAVHLERFSAGAHTPSLAGGEFSVRIASSGATYAIPKDEAITNVLAKHGIVIPTSCEQGVCGTCITDVISGTPDHRDMYLTDDERLECKKICPCVSRSLTATIELDL